MPLVSCIVDTDGTGDYLSLNAAEAANFGATSADLVANDEWVECDCQCTSGSADTTAVTIDGLTTDATHNVKIWCDPASGYRHNGVWDNIVYRIRVSSNSTDAIDLSASSYSILDGLQVDKDSTSGRCIHLTHACTSKNCIVKNATAPGFGIEAGSSQTSTINCIAVDCKNGIAGTTSSYNCVVYHSTDDGNAGIDSDDAQNSIAIGSPGSGDIVTSGNNNISGDSTATGANSLTNQVATDLFTDPANGDFSLKSGSNAIDAGTDLSAEMDAVDITGETRPQGSAWDIGAFEYVQGSGTTWNIGGVSGASNVSGVENPSEIGGVS
jgi:hypothetical protein